MEHFLTDRSYQVEHQNEPKRPQSGGWVRFDVQLGHRQKPAQIKNVKNTEAEEHLFFSSSYSLRS